MKSIKNIFCLVLIVAFFTGCEKESIQTIEESNTDLRQLKGTTAPEKEAALKEIKENAITYRHPITNIGQLCPGETASGEVAIGSFENDWLGGDFWTFTAEAGDLVTFEVNRTNCNADPIIGIFFGSGNIDDMLFFGYWDDEAEPACTPDCFAFGDPLLVDAEAPFTGVYTVGVWEWGYAPCVTGTGTYDITLYGQNACTINIDGCDSGVYNYFAGDSNMDEMIDALEAGTYRNHGQFVRAVAKLVNSWYAEGLITLGEKDAIMSCAGEANIPN